MLSNAPSGFQFVSSLVFIVIIVLALRAVATWLLRINAVLAQLRAISEAVGVPTPKANLLWPLSALQARRALSRPAEAAAAVADVEEKYRPCPCCGSVVRAAALTQARTDL